MAGAILVVAASVAIAVAFVIVVLAQLYYSLLLRRRQLQTTSAAAANYSTAHLYHQSCTQRSLGSLFFPPLHCKQHEFDAEKKQPHLHQHRIRIVSSTSVPSAVGEAELHGGDSRLYISNPVYDAAAGQPSRAETPFDTPDSSPLR